MNDSILVLIGIKLSHFALKDIVNKIQSACSVRGGHTLRWVTLRWRCVLEFQLDYNEPNSSKDCDKPQLLVQQQGIFSYLPWLTAALWFITYLVPSSSHSCKDFNTAWQLYLHCIPLHAHFIPLNMCLRLHIESVGSHSGRGFKHAR